MSSRESLDVDSVVFVSFLSAVVVTEDTCRNHVGSHGAEESSEWSGALKSYSAWVPMVVSGALLGWHSISACTEVVTCSSSYWEHMSDATVSSRGPLGVNHSRCAPKKMIG